MAGAWWRVSQKWHATRCRPATGCGQEVIALRIFAIGGLF
jgi:hypothetical protein